MQYADTYEACIYDACMCDACQKWGRKEERTDGKLNSRSRIEGFDEVQDSPPRLLLDNYHKAPRALISFFSFSCADL